MELKDIKVNIYIINSYPQSGKTTLEEQCKNIIGPQCEIISSIDFVKKIASMCGWDGSKSPKNRKFLSDLKDLLVEWDDVPFKIILNQIQHKIIEASNYDFTGKLIFFIDVREPEEIEKFKQRFISYGYNVKTIFIKRENHELGNINHADQNVENYRYDIYINNDGTLEQFRAKIAGFIFNERLIYAE